MEEWEKKKATWEGCSHCYTISQQLEPAMNQATRGPNGALA